MNIVKPTVFMLMFYILSGCTNISSREFIYIRTDTGRHLHVYDTSTMWTSVERVEYLKRRKSDSEFSGGFKYCDSPEYLCVIGGIGAAVPVSLDAQTNWDVEHWKCSSAKPLHSEIENYIECSYKNQKTKFRYLSSRGIVEYTNLNSDGEGNRFILLGEFGLLRNNGIIKN